MLLCFACARTATHTNVLDSTTKACHLVALEVAQADKYIGVHNGATNLCSLHILSALDGYIYIVRTLQTITNNNGATYRHRRKTILPRAVEVLDGVLATTRIHRVAIGKEWLSTKRSNHIHYPCSIVRTDICQIAWLSKMNLDGSELTFEINISDACPSDKALKLGQHVVTWDCPQVCEEYFRVFHVFIVLACPAEGP